MMDMSATELLKGLDRMVPARGAVLVALSLSLVGCHGPQQGTTARTTPPLPATTRGAQQLASPTKPPETLAKPAPPAPQPAQHVSQPQPPPAIPSKGAEKLAAPNPPALVRSSQRTAPAPEPPAPKAPVAESSSSVTDAPVQALIVKGPPPQIRPPHRTGLKALLWVGLVLCGAALAVAARLYLIRRAKAGGPGPPKEELKMPREMGFKEPIGVSEEPVMAKEP